MKNLFFLAAGILSLSLPVACSDDDTNGGEVAGAAGSSAGAGGSVAAGAGGGETAGAGGSVAGSGGTSATTCDPAIYGQGKACQASARCQDGDLVWRCTNGAFESLTRVASALPAACQPVGSWTLVAGEPTVVTPFNGCGPDRAQLPTSVQLVADTDGGLLSSEAGQFDTAACTLKLSHSEPHKNPSETWSLSYTATLTFAGDSASGDYTRTNTGFCVGSEKGTLTVTKKP